MPHKSFEDDLDASLDLTPLIDTVFILLIFFILTTTFSKPMLDVILPKADNVGTKELSQEKLTVTITEGNRIFFEGDAVTLEGIATRLEKLPIDTAIVFNVDKGAHFGLFVQILDTARNQGRSNFFINTDPLERKGHERPISNK